MTASLGSLVSYLKMGNEDVSRILIKNSCTTTLTEKLAAHSEEEEKPATRNYLLCHLPNTREKSHLSRELTKGKKKSLGIWRACVSKHLFQTSIPFLFVIQQARRQTDRYTASGTYRSGAGPSLIGHWTLGPRTHIKRGGRGKAMYVCVAHMECMPDENVWCRRPPPKTGCCCSYLLLLLWRLQLVPKRHYWMGEDGRGVHHHFLPPPIPYSDPLTTAAAAPSHLLFASQIGTLPLLHGSSIVDSLLLRHARGDEELSFQMMVAASPPSSSTPCVDGAKTVFFFFLLYPVPKIPILTS